MQSLGLAIASLAVLAGAVHEGLGCALHAAQRAMLLQPHPAANAALWEAIVAPTDAPEWDTEARVSFGHGLLRLFECALPLLAADGPDLLRLLPAFPAFLQRMIDLRFRHDSLLAC